MSPARTEDAADPARTWPFWAPSAADAVAAALDLAEVGPGVRVVDLGCGDGQVLVAARQRGAAVAGVEADPELADEARGHLRDAGLTATEADAAVVVADLLGPATAFDGDVFFSYLAPATLQRLVPRLPHRRVLVTVDFDVPGLVPHRRAGPARLYRLPGRRRRLGPVGWPGPATLVAAPPDIHSLTCLGAVHPAGPTRVRLTGDVAPLATTLAGADTLPAPAALAIDLRWDEVPEGTVAAGAVQAAGLERHPLIAVFTTEDEGLWELSASGLAGIRRALRRRSPPTTLAALLAAAST